jgi:hypothetical protein
MLRRNYLRSICRPAIRSDSKVPSCGTQPAHFSVDTRRHDTLDTLRGLIRSLHPTHLTKSVPYQTSQGRKLSFLKGRGPVKGCFLLSSTGFG